MDEERGYCGRCHAFTRETLMGNKQYRWKLECPRCGKASETVTDTFEPLPVVNCGDCLMDDVEVVKFKTVSVTEETV
jgi:transcription elongation factor Elf1